MGEPLSPKTPLRADYRLLRYLTKALLEGKVAPRPEEFDRIVRVFARAGGSWVRLYKGSPRDMGLIKAILKVAEKQGYLTKSPKWDGEEAKKEAQWPG